MDTALISGVIAADQRLTSNKLKQTQTNLASETTMFHTIFDNGQLGSPKVMIFSA
jgi:hypothetical protein